MINRRSLITGLISLTAAPAIVRYSSLMPVKVTPIFTDFLLNYETYGIDYASAPDNTGIVWSMSRFEMFIFDNNGSVTVDYT